DDVIGTRGKWRRRVVRDRDEPPRRDDVERLEHVAGLPALRYRDDGRVANALDGECVLRRRERVGTYAATQERDRSELAGNERAAAADEADFVDVERTREPCGEIRRSKVAPQRGLLPDLGFKMLSEHQPSTSC